MYMVIMLIINAFPFSPSCVQVCFPAKISQRTHYKDHFMSIGTAKRPLLVGMDLKSFLSG